jgi:superoxide dismutase, Cu-Zn family
VLRHRGAMLCVFLLGLDAAYLCANGAFLRSAFAQAAAPAAYADIVSPVEEKLGTAKFFPAEDGVRVELDAIQQVPGLHAVHILSVGKCEGPEFTSAGPNFDPGQNKQPGTSSPESPHAGNLPDVEAGLDGHMKATILAKGVTLGERPNSLFHPGGTAIVIDENATDAVNPEGNSGPHVACGVIKRQETTEP